ncbi:hypothetical protein EJ110_NYTH51409 [Nymphaea thermarum]|nr:hypothetical protein EJ110_NYTH51409 [Nymphaea thermarum]
MPTKSSFAQKLLHDIRKKKERLVTANNANHSNSFLALEESPKHDDHIRFSPASDNTEPHHTNLFPGKDNRFRDSGTGRHGKLLLTTDRISSKEMVVYHQKDIPASSTATGPWLPDATIVAIQILTRRRNRDSDFSKKELLEINPTGESSHGFDLNADPSCNGRVLSSSFVEANETFRGPENLNWVLEPTGSSVVLCSEEGHSVGSASRLLDGTRDLEESLHTLVHLLETSEQIVTPRRTESDRKQIRQPGSIEALVSRLLQKDGGLPLDRLLKHSRGDSRMLGAGNFGGRELLSLPPPETKQLPLSPLHSNNDYAFSPKRATIHQLPVPQRSSNSLSAASNGYSNDPTKEDGHQIEPVASRGSQQEKARIPNVIAKLMGLEELPPNHGSVAAKIQKTRDAKGPISETKGSLYQRDENITKLNSILLNSQHALLKIDLQTRMQQMDGSVTVARKAQERAPTARTTDQMEDKYAKKESPVQKKSSQTLKTNEQKNAQNIYHARGSKTTVQMSAREIQKGKVGNSITLTTEPMQPYVQKPIPRLGIEGYLVQKHLKSDTQKAELEAVAVDVDLRSKTKGSQGEIPTVRGPNNEVAHLSTYEKFFPQNVAEAKDAVHNAEGKNHGTRTQRKEQSAKDGASRPTTYTPKHMREMGRTTQYSHTAEIVDPQMRDQKNLHKAKFDGRHGNKSRSGVPGKHQVTAINKLNKRHKAVRRIENQGIVHAAETKTASKSASPFPCSVFGEEAAVLPPKTATVKELHLNKAPSSKRTPESPSFQKSKFCQEMPAVHTKTSLAQELKQRRKERMIEMANIRRSMEEATLEKHSRISEVPSTSSGVITLGEEISHDELQPESKIKFNGDTNGERETADSSLPGLPTKGNMPEPVQQEGTTIRDTPPWENAYLPHNPEHQQGTNFQPDKTSALKFQENQLKQILLSSPALLDAAKALFEIHVPTGILGASYLKGTKNHDQLLDCLHEILRRKGRREELGLHHSNKFSKYPKILSLDDLVKGLNEDLNSLNDHGDNGCLEPADYINKLIESDVQSSRPHTSCLWDVDWFEGLFAEERDRIAREVEKHILNELLKETAEQL